MDISMYSIFMSILWGNIFILILLVCRRSTKLVLSVGVFPLLLLISGSALRCFFPLDFPIFTRVISNDDLLARINTFLKSSIPTTRLTIMHLLGILWITVFMFLTMKFFIRFRRYLKKINSYIETDSPQIVRISETVAKDFGIRGLRVYQTNNTRVPLIVGLLKPRIILPVMDYTDKELEFIFIHELTHWKNHDLWVKLLVEVISDFFWWNPLMCLLKRDLTQTLEIKCDLSVVGDKDTELRYEYLETIKRIIAFKPSHHEKATFPYTVSELSGSDEHELIQRTKVVLNYKCNPFAYKAVFGTVLCLMMFLFVLSYGFIIQPTYDAPNSEIANGNYVESTPENTYICKESDGTFWVYFDGEVMEQIDPDSVEMMVGSGFIVKEKFGGSKNE